MRAVTADMVSALLNQTCTVEPHDPAQGTAGFDEMGQPLYGAPYEARCRIEPIVRIEQRLEGDLATGAGMRIFFDADDAITARSRVTLPAAFGIDGPIIVDLTVVHDAMGDVVYKEARF
jgi:hypothetical protein